QLVAYYVADQEIDAAGLGKHAATRLPDYMLPTTYIQLDTIPLNTNGKTDKRALPDPDDTASAAAGIAPRTVTEERIADIWSELLGTRVGVEDSFFQSGGNSILAIRLISRIQEEFDIDFKVRTVFEGPTVARLAAAVEAAVTAEIDAELAAYPPAAHPHATPTNGQALAKEFTV
ncbi:phosphopantetheine-binding protein, partial [Streptomyces globisporus]|uniref:phosphopantetheine-binding protein n=1 Tax=Streptomyces globisporus TaxID=1908 RepID=UPI003460EE1C